MQEYNISCYQNIALLREKRDELLRKLETETTALIDELSNSDVRQFLDCENSNLFYSCDVLLRSNFKDQHPAFF